MNRYFKITFRLDSVSPGKYRLFAEIDYKRTTSTDTQKLCENQSLALALQPKLLKFVSDIVRYELIESPSDCVTHKLIEAVIDNFHFMHVIVHGHGELYRVVVSMLIKKIMGL